VSYKPLSQTAAEHKRALELRKLNEALEKNRAKNSRDVKLNTEPQSNS
jgi:hypothetical protein